MSETVLHRITASPDVLAEKLVYCVISSENGRIRKVFRSTICDSRKFWYTEIEALAATVARLKEVCDE